jgi:hypothetical protein
MANASSLFISVYSTMGDSGDGKYISEDIGFGASNLVCLFTFLLEIR